MREFFRGWRRKAGLVTLVLALVLFVGWMRSFVVNDEIVIPRQQSDHYVGSLRGGLYWERWPHWALPIRWPDHDPDHMGWIAVNVFNPEMEPLRDNDVVWRRDWAGFDFGAAPFVSRHRIEWWRVPYWSLVLPLTLLSAWLLLIKPRPAMSAGWPEQERLRDAPGGTVTDLDSVASPKAAPDTATHH